MKKIVVLSLFVVFNILSVGNIYANGVECKAQKGDLKTFYTCLKNNTIKKQDSFGTLETFFGKTKTSIQFLNDGSIKDSTTNLAQKVVSNCIIKKEDFNKFIKLLEKWSTGSFGNSDMSYAKCTNEIIGEEKSSININLNSYKKIGDNFYEKNGKYYIFHKKGGMTFNGKEAKDLLCEIKNTNGMLFKKFGDYIFDNNNGIFKDESNNYDGKCNIQKINSDVRYDFNSLKLLKNFSWESLIKDNNNLLYIDDSGNIKIIKFTGNVEEFQNIGGSYFKDKDKIYYFDTFEGLKQLKNADSKTFKVTDDFLNKAEDKNVIYSRGKFLEEKIHLVKKNNITIKDFVIYNETFSQSYDHEADYSFDIKTNIFGKFILFVTKNNGIFRDGGNLFVNGKYHFHSVLFKHSDKNITFNIKIYDKNGPKKNPINEGRLIGTIKRVIRFTDDMKVPKIIKTEIINEDNITSTYIDNAKYNYYKKLINERFGKKNRKNTVIKKTINMKKSGYNYR